MFENKNTHKIQTYGRENETLNSVLPTGPSSVSSSTLQRQLLFTLWPLTFPEHSKHLEHMSLHKWVLQQRCSLPCFPLLGEGPYPTCLVLTGGLGFTRGWMDAQLLPVLCRHLGNARKSHGWVGQTVGPPLHTIALCLCDGL